MENISRLFVIENGATAEGWCGPSDRTTFKLSVEDEHLALKKKSGRNPLLAEVLAAVHELLLAYEEEFGAPVEVYRRRDKYRFASREGQSGCRTLYIEYDNGDGFPIRRRVYHQAATGKLPDFRCFVYFFLDLMVGEGVLERSEGHYTPWTDLDKTRLGDLKILKPRLLAYEEGWVSPWEAPPASVPLAVCREVPIEE